MPKTIVHEDAGTGSERSSEVNNVEQFALLLVIAVLTVPVGEIKP
jgi:hypothetical protein